MLTIELFSFFSILIYFPSNAHHWVASFALQLHPALAPVSWLSASLAAFSIWVFTYCIFLILTIIVINNNNNIKFNIQLIVLNINNSKIKINYLANYSSPDVKPSFFSWNHEWISFFLHFSLPHFSMISSSLFS